MEMIDLNHYYVSFHIMNRTRMRIPGHCYI